MEIDRAQIEQRMSFTRENYRMAREKLMEIMYWDKDAHPGERPPQKRDIVEAASRRLRSSIGCRRKSSPSSSIRSKAQCTVVGSALWPRIRSNTARPLSSHTMASPLIRQERAGKAAIAIATKEKRRVRSLPEFAAGWVANVKSAPLATSHTQPSLGRPPHSAAYYHFL